MASTAIDINVNLASTSTSSAAPAVTSDTAAVATLDTITSEQVGAYYDQLVQYYRMVWDGNLHMGYWKDDDPNASLQVAQENLTDILVERTPVGPGKKVLDVGCGFGRPAIKLAEKTGCSVEGITISREQAAEANRYAQERGLSERAVFRHMDAMAMTFEPDSFDAVWAFECLFHMPDRVQVLRQIARVLRPGGRLILTDSCGKVPFTPIEMKLMHDGFQVNAYMSPDEYTSVLRTLGIKVTEVVDMSKNTSNSYTAVMEATMKNEAALRAIYGEGFIAQMQHTAPMLDAINREKLEYFWLVAEKVVW